MLKKTVKYVDYNGVERTEDFYFHLSEAELAEMELSETGGLSESIQKIISAKDNAAIIKIFKDIVVKAYGVKSADGRQFVKNDEVRASFVQSPAYSIIFMELGRDADAAAKFVEAVIPKVD